MSVTKLKMKNLNKSGIYPSGNRVLIHPDELEKVTAGGIVIPEQHLERYQQAQASGYLVASGPDAFSHTIERVYHIHGNGARELVEEKVKGYSEPFAEPGDRISFAKYAGQVYKGKDGKRYLVVNDEDVTCRLDDEVELTSLDTRKGLGL